MSVGEELEGKGGHHSNSVLSEPCGKVSHHTAHRLDLPRSLKNREETGPVVCWISGEDGARLLRLTVKTG
uniref:Uncharacterized protein n=1 Tax=Populus trichocarpa TaxID=3694 RepID=B9NFR6_POPTR